MTDKNRTIVRARDIMGSDLHFIDGVATVEEATQMMREKNTTTLIVKKRNENDAWGMVVSQDMIKGVIIADKSPDKVNVYEIMAKPIVTVPPDMDVRYVARLMHRIGVRRMPVVENGELVGMVTQSDITLKSNLL